MTRTSEPASDTQIPQWLERLGLDGIVDLHVHFMPDRVLQKVWGFFDQVGQDGVPPWPIHYRYSEAARVRILGQLGVRAFGTLNYAHRPGMARWLNDYSTDFAARYPQAIHSGTFYPESGADQVVADSLEAGARLFKVHVQVGGFTPLDERLAEAWGLLEHAGVPVVIHCGHGPHPGTHTGIGPIRQLLERFPSLVLVIAHAGLPDYLDFAELAARHPSVYLDTTMVGTSYMEQLFPVPENYAQVLAELAGKVVLGTDFPSIPYSYSHQLQVLDSWKLGHSWLADTLWNTPRRLVSLA